MEYEKLTAEEKRAADDINEIFLEYLSDFPRPKDFEFKNGKGYVQHPVENMEEMFLKLVETSMENSEVLKTIYGKKLEEINKIGAKALSWCVRFGSECGSAPIENAWNIAYCIDFESGKEWGQPAFANGMERGKHENEKCLNGGAWLARKEKREMSGALKEAGLKKRKLL